MAAITVRNLDDDVQRLIKQRAAQNNRSMEAEARAILSAAVKPNTFISVWLDLARMNPDTGIEPPVRSAPRDLDLA